MGSTKEKQEARFKRKRRIRKKILGTGDQPRLNVFRSSKHIYAQLIDDIKGSTLAAASSLEKTAREQQDLKGKLSIADFVGKLVAERALENGIKKVVFDRGGFLYHGRVKAVSEGARKAGLKF